MCNLTLIKHSYFSIYSDHGKTDKLQAVHLHTQAHNLGALGTSLLVRVRFEMDNFDFL
jgi:hypothetical protein